MDDLTQALEGVGLGQYRDVMVENDVDFGTLLQLTENDLRELGLSLGHRRVLLKAIGEWSSKETAPRLDALPERRQVTIVFVDLVDSTRLANALEPERYREILVAYQNVASRVIGKYEGHIAQYLGDGLLAYFGYPTAHESDAVRGVLAAHEIVDWFRTAPGSDILASVQVRVGIATGLTIVGDLASSGARQNLAVGGQTPNLAARLQSLAPPNGVVISASTRRLVGSETELRSMGLLEVKGFDQPQEAWLVVRPALQETRFASRGNTSVLAGREDELQALRRQRDAARDEGRTILALVSGEAGIGKSHLVHLLKEDAPGDGGAVFQCSHFYQSTPLYPIVQTLLRRLGSAEATPEGNDLAALVDRASQAATNPAEWRDVIGNLLELWPSQLELPPQSLKELTLAALAEFFLPSSSRPDPQIVIFEDLHWADPTTMEFLRAFRSARAGVAALVLCTSREPVEIGQDWTEPLERLDPEDSRRLAAQLAGASNISEEALSVVVQRSDGIPLFVKELTEFFWESGYLRADGSVITSLLKEGLIEIPATLQDVLMWRLDRTPGVRAIAQAGSIFGREFDPIWVAGLLEMSDPDLDKSIRRLISSGLALEGEEGRLIFSHALVRDAAYNSILLSARALMHLRAVEVLRNKLPGIDETAPELLAHHLTLAGGQSETVIPLWVRAGQRAIGQWAIPEAVVRLRQGLELLPLVENEEARVSLEMAVRMALGTAYQIGEGWTSPNVLEALSPILDVSLDRAEPMTAIGVAQVIFTHHFTRGEWAKADPLAAKMLEAGRARGDNNLIGMANGGAALADQWMGNLARSREESQTMLDLCDPVFFAQHVNMTNHELTAITSHQTRNLWILGRPTEAAAAISYTIDRARSLNHPLNLGLAYCMCSFVHLLEGDYPSADAFLDAADELAEKFRLVSIQFVIGPLFRGLRSCYGPEPSASAADQFAGALTVWQSVGGSFIVPSCLIALAHLRRRLGDDGSAREALIDAERIAVQTLEQADLAEIFRLRASLEPEDEAAAYWLLRRAIQTAVRQGALVWELRARIDLVELLRARRGLVEHEESALAECVRRHPEGRGRDVDRARELLARVGALGA